MLSVRELTQADIPLLLDYWFTADKDFLTGMGVDISKMRTQDQFKEMLHHQLSIPIDQKKSYCIIWLLNQEPIGHSNTNPTIYGAEAKMHLHLWHSLERKKGIGTELVKLTLPYFFNNLKLQTLWCEPYALNPAPNRTLEKAGFEFVKEYVTIPGFINFEQPVKQWKLSREQFKRLNL
jgi:RimJ/RimL family protein N-acetyltransferase